MECPDNCHRGKLLPVRVTFRISVRISVNPRGQLSLNWRMVNNNNLSLFRQNLLWNVHNNNVRFLSTYFRYLFWIKDITQKISLQKSIFHISTLNTNQILQILQILQIACTWIKEICNLFRYQPPCFFDVKMTQNKILQFKFEID